MTSNSSLNTKLLDWSARLSYVIGFYEVYTDEKGQDKVQELINIRSEIRELIKSDA